MVNELEVSGAAAASIGDTDRENKARLELIYEVSKKVGTAPRMTQLLDRIIEMTQQTLKASAASILLTGDNDQDLFFEAASGPVGHTLKRVRVSSQNGIAGKVTRTGQPLIVNCVSDNDSFDRSIDKITGFETKSIICVPLVLNRRTLGVIEVLNKTDGSCFGEHDLAAVTSVATTAAMAIENARLNQNLLDAYKITITTLAAAIDAKDPYTRGHSERVMKYALMAGSVMGLAPEELETLEYAGILHDVGKIAIDAKILNKPDTLSEEEWEKIREHPITGARLLKQIPFLEKVSRLVLHHHERYDGQGYPAGLKGEDIPVGARLLAVADAFDTMTTDRAYRPALTVEYSISEFYGCAGTHFCPAAVEAFVTAFRRQAEKIFDRAANRQASCN